jgi:ABC-type spermidine/putrescine transport system permease subunit II
MKTFSPGRIAFALFCSLVLLHLILPVLIIVPMSFSSTGGLNRSAEHSNLLAKMECGHEAATSHLLFCGSAV